MLGFANVLFGVGMLVYIVLNWRPIAVPRGEPEYGAFEVAVDGEQITVKNAGPEVLVNVQLEFAASFTGGEYQGTRFYDRWAPGEVQKFGIISSRGPERVESFRFTGDARSTNPDQWFKLTFASPADR